jgi:serine protease AprX
MNFAGHEIIPTVLRLNADPRFTGKGVTICFIDNDFYPHPDLTARKNRIKAIVDIPANRTYTHANFPKIPGASWHGTMTSVVCAGDGYLSNGLYKGIACDAELVLLKIQTGTGEINDDNIINALEWVLHHHYQYQIRIVNISLGAREAVSYKQSRIDMLAEKLFEKGIVVIAAVGNDEQGTIKSPANSPNVIAVGGVDDDRHLYHSSYGKTVDGLMKPELVAHAMWVAAPIMPETKEQQEASLLFNLLQAPRDEATGSILERIKDLKYISPHYMHVDGTSFAAPIVSAVAAQLLEIDPALTPAATRLALLVTAKRLKDFPAQRQGFGVVQPRKATLKILNRQIMIAPGISPAVNSQSKTIGFYIRHDCASQVTLSGSFNGWSHHELMLEPGGNGIWQIEIPMLPPGKYEYKFFVDDMVWVEDINNPYREPDGFNGFNSILIVEN